MIGSFMINPEQEVCFAQFSDERKISSVVVLENKTVLFTYSDETDEMMTEELDEKVFDIIKTLDRILVAQVGSDGEPTAEDYAEVIFQK